MQSFPFEDDVYQLGDASIVQPLVDDDLFSINVQYVDLSSCGPYQVDFFDVDSNWYFDTQFFTQVNNEFVVE